MASDWRPMRQSAHDNCHMRSTCIDHLRPNNHTERIAVTHCLRPRNSLEHLDNARLTPRRRHKQTWGLTVTLPQHPCQCRNNRIRFGSCSHGLSKWYDITWQVTAGNDFPSMGVSQLKWGSLSTPCSNLNVNQVKICTTPNLFCTCHSRALKFSDWLWWLDQNL